MEKLEKREIKPTAMRLLILKAMTRFTSSPEGGAFIIPSLLMMHKTSPFGRGGTAQP